LSTCFSCLAQDNNNTQLVANFKNYFNKRLTDSIYMQWSEQAKKAVVKSQLDTLLEKQLYPLGDIQSLSFIKQQGAFSHYKLAFKNTALQLIVSADSTNKVETFYFKPYIEPLEANTVQQQNQPDTSRAIASNPDSIAPTNASNENESTIDLLIDSLALNYTTMPTTSGLAIGLIANGKTNYYYYGETTQRNNVLPDKETLFEIGSITKTFTATLLARAVLQGTIKLADPILKYLPDSVAQNENLAGITFQNLATHTAGLPRLPSNLASDETLDPYKDYDVNALFSYLKHYKQHQKPDSLYEYSNLGYGIIGELLAQQYHLSYSELIEKEICKPLGLVNTTEFPDSDKLQDFIPTYNKEGDLTPHWHFQALSGAGSLKSTVADLLKYAEANLNIQKTPLGNAIALTHKPSWLVSETQDLGLAWHINIEDFQEIFWHNGSTLGSSSFLAFVPGKNIAIVVLANAAQAVDNIGFAIIRKLIEQ